MAALLLMAAALLGLVQSGQGLPFREVVPLRSKEMRPAGDDTYAVAGTLKNWLSQPMHARVSLREDGLSQREQARSSQAVREADGLAFALGSRQMWFRATDGSDPRQNGRHYALVLPWLPAPWVPVVCRWVLLLIPLSWAGVSLAMNWHLILERLLKRGFAGLVERTLVAGLVLACFTPGVLMIGLRLGGSHVPPLPWLQNTTLSGVTVPKSTVPCSASTLVSGAWQKQTAGVFDASFPGREAMIRLTAEAWYRGFRRTALDSTTIKLGLGDNLFEQAYLDDYAFLRTTTADLESQVAGLRRLQDVLRARGIGFVFVITPSKAAVLPEALPAHWRARHDPRPRGYDQILPLLDRHGVIYVDGHAITCEAVATAVAPVFPKGGTHWAPFPAVRTTQEIAARFQTQGVPVLPVELVAETLHDAPLPKTEEEDLMRLMNLAVPWRYPVSELTIKAHDLDPAARLKKLTVVGGSFTAKICTQFQATKQFKEIGQWFYLQSMRVLHHPDGGLQVTTPAPVMDVRQEVFGAECVIVECNEQALFPTLAPHVWQFVQAVTAAAEGNP